MVDILAAAICRAHDRHIMCDADHISERFNMIRWIASYISPLGNDTPWIKG